MDIFEVTQRPDDSLFFQSYDPNDLRLGNIVKSDPTDYPSCKYVLLGYPYDEGVIRNHGRPGAKLAPEKIRSDLYTLAHPRLLETYGFFDLGNIRTEGTLEEIHELQYQVVKQVLEDDKILLIIGGGNDISYADCKALSSVSSNPLVINIDMHFDMRENQRMNSGTPYRWLLEQHIVLAKDLVQLGCQPMVNSYVYKEYLEARGVDIIYLDTIFELGMQHILFDLQPRLNSPQSIFWGFDMDSVRASDAPGVSATNPVGIKAEEAVMLAKFAGRQPNSKIFEITEVNPLFDVDTRTTKLAAMLLMNFVSKNLLKE